MEVNELEELRSQVNELAAELGAVMKNRDSILREKRELQTKLRVDGALQAADDQLRRDRGESVEARQSQREAAYTLTVDEARDPQRYRTAREAARQAGLKTGPIIIDPAAAPEKGGADVRAIRTESAIYVRNDVGRDVRQYRRLRDEAERGGKTLRMFHNRANLAAISSGDPDALTYFDRIASGDGSAIIRENAG